MSLIVCHQFQPLKWKTIESDAITYCSKIKTTDTFVALIMPQKKTLDGFGFLKNLRNFPLSMQWVIHIIVDL